MNRDEAHQSGGSELWRGEFDEGYSVSAGIRGQVDVHWWSMGYNEHRDLMESTVLETTSLESRLSEPEAG
jgi:hypothetical protein